MSRFGSPSPMTAPPLPPTIPPPTESPTERPAEPPTEAAAGASVEFAGATAIRPRRRLGLLRSRLFRWLVATVLVIGVVLLAAAWVSGAVGAQTAGDPSSSTRDGSGAVAQLLRDQGVRLIRTEDVGAASRDATGPTTLVIVHPERLTAAESTRLLSSRPARIVLVRASAAALVRFGVPARITSEVAGGAPLSPACADPVAQRAGAILPAAGSIGYAAGTRHDIDSSDLGCYPVAGGALYRQIVSRAGVVDLVGTGFPNEQLAEQGNASFALGVLGSQPTVVWLMAQRVQPSAGNRPALLPSWWDMVAVQALIGLAAVAVWRGRRLGPIIVERLRVLVPASETVEGHGRLYYRLTARDRAATALRSGVCRRLGPRYGQRTDPRALAQAIADRTGRDPAQVQAWLAGPTPTDDQQLEQLAHDLDQLEQEAQQL